MTPREKDGIRDGIAVLRAVRDGDDDAAGVILSAGNVSDVVCLLAGIAEGALRTLIVALGTPPEEADAAVDAYLTGILRQADPDPFDPALPRP